jgi:prevent-host-death family protein
MLSVGVRELKTHLSRHLKRVRAGERLLVTERGRPVATIEPMARPASVEWATAFVSEGRAAWSGGKPAGLGAAPSVGRDRSVASAVIEDRR